MTSLPKTTAELLAELTAKFDSLVVDVTALKTRLTQVENNHVQKFTDLSRALNLNRKDLGEVEAKTEMVSARMASLVRKVRKTK